MEQLFLVLDEGITNNIEVTACSLWLSLIYLTLIAKNIYQIQTKFDSCASVIYTEAEAKWSAICFLGLVV